MTLIRGDPQGCIPEKNPPHPTKKKKKRKKEKVTVFSTG